MGFNIGGREISNIVEESNDSETVEQVVSGNERRDSVANTEFQSPDNDSVDSPTQNSGWVDDKIKNYNQILDSNLDIGNGGNIKGSPSLFNKYALFALHSGNKLNSPVDFLDSDGGNKFFREDYGELNTQTIVNKFNPKEYPSRPYYYTDFAFLTYWEKIPENRLITVRRYPHPVYDNITFPSIGSEEKNVKPIAQAVTYFGNPTGNSLSDLLNVKGEIGWKELTADFQDLGANNQGFDDTPLVSGRTRKVARGVSALTGKGDVSQRRARDVEFQKKFNWENSVRGDVNVINKTHIRKNGIGAGVGDYKIEFEYSMRSFNGVNPKIAMLDLITNFLSLAYQDGKFWGGDIRFFPNSPRYPFIGDQNAFYDGRYGDYAQSIMGDLRSAMGNLGDTFGGIINGLLSGDMSAIGESFGKIVGAGMDVISGKNRPQVIGFKALLSGEHVGEYHMTVGNPFNPIAMIGNLIATSWEFKLSEELGMNDFPTSIKFALNLKDAMPRDKSGIESILNKGNGKMYLQPREFERILGADGKPLTEEDIKKVSGTAF